NNVAPTLTVAANQTINEGQLLSLTDIGRFTDPGFDNPLNTGETAETFTYDINWGDGRPHSTGSPTLDTAGRVRVPPAGSFDGNHTYADNGTYTVTVIVSDDDTGSDQKTFQVTVNNVAPTLAVVANQIVNEGQALSLTDIGTFTDPGFANPLNPPPGQTAETFTYDINWGDGQPHSTGTATI